MGDETEDPHGQMEFLASLLYNSGMSLCDRCRQVVSTLPSVTRTALVSAIAQAQQVGQAYAKTQDELEKAINDLDIPSTQLAAVLSLFGEFSAAGETVEDALLGLIHAVEVADDQIELIEQGLAAVRVEASKLTHEITKLKNEKADAQFLATYRDYISRFRSVIVISGISGCATWQELAEKLQTEAMLNDTTFDGCAAAADSSSSQQALLNGPDEWECHRRLVQALNTAGFSWADWCSLRQIADASVSMSHQGHSMSIQQALTALDTNTVRVPANLEDAKPALMRALRFTRDAIMRSSTRR
jgi:cell division protein FtsB